MPSLVRWRIEPRAVPGRVGRYRVGAVAVGVVVAVLIELALSGESAQAFFESLWRATLGTPVGFTTFAVLATPLIFTALAAAIPLRLGLWNIGGDGQLFLGAWGAFAVGQLFPHLATVPLVALMLVAAILCGAIWSGIAALALVRVGVNEIITTLILNFIAGYWVLYWAGHPWAEGQSVGGVQSKLVPEQAWIGAVRVNGVAVPIGFIVAILLAVAVWLWLRRSRFGFQMSIVGSSRRAATYAGMHPGRVMAASMLAGGAVAGMAGAIVMLGDVHRYGQSLSNESGYTGVVIAVLAGASALASIPLALLFATIAIGNNLLAIFGVSSYVQFALYGLILIVAAFGQGLSRLRLVRVRRPAAAAPPPPRPQEAGGVN